MKTPPVLNMPRPLDITRARCAEGEYRDYPTVDWTNFMSSYMNDFCNTLSFYFPRVYYDMRYGYLLFGNYGGTYTLSGETVTGIPGYWWWLPWFTFPSYPSEDVLPHGELAYSTGGLRINIDGTTYDAWFAAISVFDAAAVSEDVSVVRIYPAFTRQNVDNRSNRRGADYEYSTYALLLTAYASPIYLITNSDGCGASVGITAVYNFGVLDRVGGDAHSTFVSFDTSSLSGASLTVATLKLYVTAITTTFGTNQINLYNHGFDTLDSGDWTGGTLITTISASSLSVGLNSIDIPTGNIDQDNRTQFRISSKYEEDNGLPPQPACSDSGAAISSDNDNQTVNFDFSQSYLEVG